MLRCQGWNDFLFKRLLKKDATTSTKKSPVKFSYDEPINDHLPFYSTYIVKNIYSQLSKNGKVRKNYNVVWNMAVLIIKALDWKQRKLELSL